MRLRASSNTPQGGLPLRSSQLILRRLQHILDNRLHHLSQFPAKQVVHACVSSVAKRVATYFLAASGVAALISA